MNVEGHESRLQGSNPLRGAVEEAQSVFRGGDFFGVEITLRNVGAGAIALASLAIVAAAYRYGVPTSYVMAQELATENALTYYSTIAGIGGFVGSIIASNRLASVQGDTVTLGQMAAPMLVTAGGNVLAGFIFPSG